MKVMMRAEEAGCRGWPWNMCQSNEKLPAVKERSSGGEREREAVRE